VIAVLGCEEVALPAHFAERLPLDIIPRRP
jgi:hypothetical protein